MLSVSTLTPTLSFGSNMYILESGGEYAVIDPSVEIMDALRRCPFDKDSLKYIIITHAHFDHFLEIDSWKKETGAAVLVSEYDGASLADSYKNAYKVFFGVERGYYGPYTTLSDKEEIHLGDDILTVYSTPGHTQGGICLLCGNVMFSGDTVFANGGYGRYDLPGGDYETLVASLRYLCTFDKGIKVYPGHGGPTDIAEIYSYFSNIN